MNNKEEYSKALEDINDKLISNREEYTQTIEKIKTLLYCLNISCP